MDRRPIASSDLAVSVIGLGCNNFGPRLDAAAANRLVHAALDSGINFFDTADAYGAGASEIMLGEALKGRRDQAVVATKFGLPMSPGARQFDATPAYVRQSLDASLKRLQTDYVDLFYLHYEDPDTPPEATMEALDGAVRAGKVRQVACSNVSVGYLKASVSAARARNQAAYIAVQDEYSLLYRGVETELTPAIEALGLAMIPFYPLASGLLTGKYRKGLATPEGSRLSGAAVTAPRFLTEANLDVVEAIYRFADERGLSILEVAIAWLLAQKSVPSVIAGASNPEQLAANARAANAKLSAADVEALGQLTAHRRTRDPDAPFAPHEALRAKIRV